MTEGIDYFKEMQEKWKEVYDQLAAPMPVEARQHAPKSQTRKSYDMTGYNYQYCANRFNEVLGPMGWSFRYEQLSEDKGTWGRSGKEYFDITVQVTISLHLAGETTSRIAPGGHRADSKYDALKGAVTNGFKKCASFYGVGKAAYEGTIDDDFRGPDGYAQEGTNRDGPIQGGHGGGPIGPVITEESQQDMLVKEARYAWDKCVREKGTAVAKATLGDRDPSKLSIDGLKQLISDFKRAESKAEELPKPQKSLADAMEASKGQVQLTPKRQKLEAEYADLLTELKKHDAMPEDLVNFDDMSDDEMEVSINTCARRLAALIGGK